MRIISGKYKGRRFNPPKNITARPTTDFAKESLFNLLNNRISFEEIDVLDLFAGTGSISLISTKRELGINNLMLIRGDVFKYLGACRLQFDFIYADPPYDLDLLPTLPDLVFGKELLKEDGIFVLEHSAKQDFSAHPHFLEHRNYGSVNFSFFA